MKIANVHEAKSQLSKLLDAAERGEDVFITRRGSRFRLVPAPVVPRTDLFGILRHELPGGVEPDYEAADQALEEILDEYFEKEDEA